MTTATKPYPIEMYLAAVDEWEPDAEYIDGVIEERPMGEFDHAAWQMAIAHWFETHAEKWDVYVLPELRSRVKQTRIRIADVTLVDGASPEEQVLTHPPLAVFEVMSPEDRVTRVMSRLADFEQMGVTNIFLIDPAVGVFQRYVRGELRNESKIEIRVGKAHRMRRKLSPHDATTVPRISERRLTTRTVLRRSVSRPGARRT